eukprot:TRINITY_DN681_c0_g1_i12.p2 TRINITY_DN681_c0_g1~~TRINITY_DN681_c0_g1_i12.p2  ORF type:complete len:117 (-),score=24.18 TRINITY_DN681_c0_g1_i12:454-804(-)
MDRKGCLMKWFQCTQVKEDSPLPTTTWKLPPAAKMKSTDTTNTNNTIKTHERWNQTPRTPESCPEKKDQVRNREVITLMRTSYLSGTLTADDRVRLFGSKSRRTDATSVLTQPPPG